MRSVIGAADIGKAINQVDIADPVEATDWRGRVLTAVSQSVTATARRRRTLPPFGVLEMCPVVGTTRRAEQAHPGIDRIGR